MWCRVLFLGLYLLFQLDYVLLLENGLARTPPMGWMSWGYYMCGTNCEKHPQKCLDEKLILSVADKFYNEGYQEAGFEYIIIDDCWSERHRVNGTLVPDRKRFPNGMKFLADYIHSRGLKFGMYTNIDSVTCMHYPGSRGYFNMDAKTFASWDVDYIKVDGCFVAEDYLNVAYIDFGKQLRNTSRPMVYSCSWPYYIKFTHQHDPHLKAVAEHCNMWRNYHDVVTSWSAVKTIIGYYESEYENLVKYHGPGHWNDPDMLIFGTGALTNSQSRVHIAVYTMLSAPLLLSCDMNNITPYEKELLTNLDLIVIGQDALGVMARPYKLENGITLWVKHHLPIKGNIYHSFSFALVNFNTMKQSVSFTPVDYGLDCQDGYEIMDVFTKTFPKNITFKERLSFTVPEEDVIFFTLFPL